MSNKDAEALTYESAMKELEQILADLEGGDVGIDELTEKITRAKYLGTYCKERLRKTDEEVRKLLETGTDKQD